MGNGVMEMNIFRCYQTCIEKKEKQNLRVNNTTLKNLNLVYRTAPKQEKKENEKNKKTKIVE